MAATAPTKKPRKQNRGAKPPDRKLAVYRGKRDFRETSEPAGRVAKSARARFVVQKHAASRLHYDFRLEVGGVLKSWAVPKEIPLHVGEKALAVMVEDHPVEYGKFEGTIPKGQYGGGTVMLWDQGSYRAEGNDPASAIKDGKIHFHLTGKKLRGEWALVRMRGEENQWLIIKSGEDLRPAASTWDLSATTSRTMKEIGTAKRTEKSEWHPEPAFIEPMKARPSAQLPTGDEWLYELKFDGYRFLATKGGEAVRLWSRTENDLSARFPEITAAVRALPCDTAILDGELIVPDERGRPSFQLLQNARETTPVEAFVFDLIHLDGDDLKHLPLSERRTRLAPLLEGKAPLHLSPELDGDAESVLASVRQGGLEGIIAKRRAARYEPGRRSGAWVKVKCLLEQEFVIGGFTAPKGTRSHFGALIMGCFQKRRLIFAGKVGTGFDQKTLAELHRQMSALQVEKCPFAGLPTRRSRWAANFTQSELARCTWVEPRLVAQVRFAEWTGDGVLRQPAYLGLRDDKAARDVVRET